MLSYEQVIAIGKKHYNEGGDSVVECLDRETYNWEVANGLGSEYKNEKTLLESFRFYDAVRRDVMTW